MKRIVGLMTVLTVLSGLVSCKKDKPDGFADLVVYGEIFTSESDALAGAFAVKDGKYIYVGDKAGAQQHMGAKTQVIDHTGKGLVMPGCTEGHGHYFMSSFYDYGDYVIRMESTDGSEAILAKLDAMMGRGPKYVYGFGFNYTKLKNENDFPTRAQLDARSKTLPIYLADSEGHKGIANTYCFEKAGILDADGKVKESFKYKKYVVTDTDGYPTGLLLEQAGTYVRVKGCTPTDGPQVWEKVIEKAQKKLNSQGYTAAFEGWANKFGMTTYTVANKMDMAGNLSLNLGMAYEIENLSEDEVKEALSGAIDAKKYSTSHVHADFVKLFEDGTPETGTGYMAEAPSGGSKGSPIWSETELKDITVKANEAGLTMHIHAMGDAAVNEVVNAYENSFNAGYRLRNQIVHLRNVAKDDYDRMARCGIVASCGVIWHWMQDGAPEYFRANNILAEPYIQELYPYQSFLDHGVRTSISTDAPASSGSPTDPFGIMEIAQTGKMTFMKDPYCSTPWNTQECIKERADFLRSLTIEGAYQMYTEDTRGSIAVGKFADFILIDQNVLKCDAEKLHETKVLKTFFEGRCVYTLDK